MENILYIKLLVIGIITLFVGAGAVQSINSNSERYIAHFKSDSWWDDDWLYRKEININSEMVEGSHNNFPVLIKLESDDDLAIKAQNDGDDIVFTDYSGNKLNHEIELFNNEDGELIAWVNTQYFSSQLILFMYYGNPICDNQENIEGTWESGYKGVWHLNENPGDTAPQYRDSTIYSNDGTAKNMEVEDQIPGKINYAVRLNEGYGNPPQEYIDCGSDSSIRITQDITISSWVNCDTFEEDKYFYWLCTTYGGAEYYSRINPGWYEGYDRLAWWRDSTQYNIHDVDGTWPRSGWHYFVVTDDKSTVSLYIDGSLRKSADSGLGSIGNFPLQIGSSEGRNNNMDAILDETRLSNIVRNIDWIFTEYNNQNNPSAFLSLGIEEKGSIPPGAPTINGPIAGKIKTKHTYTFVSIDPNGDNVSYQIDWGDGNIEDWFGPYESNEIISRSHSWSNEGVFVIQARAKDINDKIGDWGTLDVTMPKNKPYVFNFPLLNWLFDRFPSSFPAFRLILRFF